MAAASGAARTACRAPPLVPCAPCDCRDRGQHVAPCSRRTWSISLLLHALQVMVAGDRSGVGPLQGALHGLLMLALG